MMRSFAFFLTIIAICLIPGKSCFADFIEDSNKFSCEKNDINIQKAQTFLNKFNDLVQADDRNSIAKMVHYPLQVYKRNKKGKINYEIEDEEDFLGQYRSLFNEEAKKSLAENHKAECHPLGILYTASGSFSFNYSDEGIKIVTIDTIKNY